MTGFCAHFCLVPYRLTMRTVLVNADDLSLEAMTPIQTILRKTEDLKGAKRKLSWACAAMRRYRICLDACSGSLHKQVVIIGMGPWNELCSALQVRHSGMEEFLQCFKQHSARIDEQCEPYEEVVKELLTNASKQIRAYEYGEIGHLCSAMQEFEECYKNAEHPCEEKARKLWQRLQQSTNKAFREIIAIDFIHQRLPLECKSSNILATIASYIEHVDHTQATTTSKAPDISVTTTVTATTTTTTTEIAVLNELPPTNLSTSTATMQYQGFMYSGGVLVSGILVKYCQSELIYF